MNSVSHTPPEPVDSGDFFTFNRRVWEKSSFLSSNTTVEIAAAGMSHTAYHPLRTVATRLSAGVPVEWKLNALFRGYWSSAVGAHQLALAPLVYQSLYKWFFPNNENEPTPLQKIAMGGVAGLSTTPTVVPLDMATVQRQLNQSFDRRCLQLFFRGFFPSALRQAGTGAGMVVLPGILENKVHESFRSYAANHEKQVKVATAATAGIFAAMGTQYFEMARLLMQADVKKEKYSTSLEAFKAVPEQLFSPRGAKMTAVRFTVVVVATVVMNQSREFFSKTFKVQQ